MTHSEMLSCAALAVSGVSLFTSLHVAQRDTVKLRAWATFHPVHEHNPEPYITVVIVNEGRRPAILRIFGGDCAEGSGGTYLGDKGLRLGENERHEEHVGFAGLALNGPDEMEFVSLWFEDSLGNRHKVKDSDSAICSFRAA